MERRPGRRLGIWAIVLLVTGAVLAVVPWLGTLALTRHEIKAYSVPSDSMIPTYWRGDLAYFALGDADDLGVGRGDVVLFSAPEWVSEGPGLKRVVAVGGDRISYRRGDATLMLNGKPLDEPYVKDRAMPSTVPFEVTVPEGRMFLMGDNRLNSADSSMRLGDDGQGSLPLSAVRGKAIERPTAVIVAGGAQLLGMVVFLTGGGLGIAALVVRRRAAARAARVPVWPTPGA
ncbi:signal peptidase I [Streptomyces sp. ISL-86]|uniref:signal peptidase I n=1 Tax=Streptomyces sp. ISL-86 TaxID=2819187 RepID=UPI001BEA31DA|nr:signal peptidase I [Streptomyces sp. ISL-86]MBT2456680.1 signal peptidase I [Streptomyces sp. ISL-86]